MISPDAVNGLFELLGSFFILASVFKLAKDKKVLGVHWVHVAFFSAWGFWSLYYYPSLDQWVSFFGGLGLVATNTFYLGQILYYRRNENQ